MKNIIINSTIFSVPINIAKYIYIVSFHKSVLKTINFKFSLIILAN